MKTRFEEKIKKFTRNCNLFVQSGLSLREKFRLFNVPERRLDDFEEVTNWKFVFIGTAAEFNDTRYTQRDFPDYPAIQHGLYIFKPGQLDYLVQLVNLTHSFAQNEFFATIGFTPQDLGEDETMALEYVKAEGKLVVSGSREKADVYLLKIPVKKLLKIVRVSRYEGIPLALEEYNSDRYQRLLIEEKVVRIAKGFVRNDERRSFPNTLTLVLSSDCEERHDGKLHIPKRYSSVDIIDGQHRLFAYSHPYIREDVREGAEILASAIKFRTGNARDISRRAARLFCEINSNQAKVKNSLRLITDSSGRIWGDDVSFSVYLQAQSGF